MIPDNCKYFKQFRLRFLARYPCWGNSLLDSFSCVRLYINIRTSVSAIINTDLHRYKCHEMYTYLLGSLHKYGRYAEQCSNIQLKPGTSAYYFFVFLPRIATHFREASNVVTFRRSLKGERVKLYLLVARLLIPAKAHSPVVHN